MMEIKKYITKINFNTVPNRKIEWIVIHYTANNGDTAWGNCNYFHDKDRQASAHYFVDENSIWQCVEDKDVAWHCGTPNPLNGCRNTTSIGIEMCSRKDENGVYYFKEETVQNAIELTKELMEKYNIDINHVCRHFDVSGKRCPEPYVRDEEAWQDFKRRLEEEPLPKERTLEENMAIVQERCGYDDNTMMWLSRYIYRDSLFKKWTESYDK